MITFMHGILEILTSNLFLHFWGLGFVTASGLLLDFIFCYRGK